MGGRHNGASAAEPFRRTRLVEGGRLGVQFHIPREDCRPEHPWVVEVVLPGLDK